MDVHEQPTAVSPARGLATADSVVGIGRRLAAAGRGLPASIRVVPFTAGLITVIVLVAAVTGAFTGAHRDVLAARVGYGLPALIDGQLWRFLVGASILPEPTQYLVMGSLIALAVGYFERRVGAVRAAAALAGTHLVGTVGAAALLSVAGRIDWPWARLVAGDSDLGMSAGTIGVLAAASCLMCPTMRRRVRWIGSAYFTIMVLRSGLLWDAEHLVGWFTGLLAGPLLAGSPTRTGRAATPPRIKLVRSAVAWSMVVLAVTRVVSALYPGNGGVFGHGIPAGDVHPGHLAAGLVCGAVVLLVANALRRGLPLAWWAAVAVSVLSMTRAGVATFGRYPADLLLWGLLLAALLATRTCWPWRVPAGALRRVLPRLLTAAGIFIAASTMLLWSLRSQIGPQSSPVHARQIVDRAVFSGPGVETHTRTAHTLLTLSSIAWGIVLVVLLVPLLYAFQTPRRRDHQKDSRLPASDRLAAMIRAHGGGNLGWQRTWPAFTSWFSAGNDVAVGFRVVSGVAIVVGDPVGPQHRWRAAAAEFQTFCLRSGWTPAWYAVTDRFLESAGDCCWQHHQIGQDAVIELADLSFTGKSWQDVRTARNRAARDGIRFVEVDPSTADPEMMAGIHQLCQAWADGKPLPEMGFTLGTVDLARDGVMRTHAAVDGDNVVHGVTTWMPVHESGRVVGWTLDVMRRRSDGFRPVMEFLLAESLLAFQREGCELASLSVAPLARPVSPDHPTAPLDRLERALDRMSELLEPAYGFRSLLAYKKKFHPRFQPVHLAYGFQVDLAEIAVAIGRAYLPELTAGQALSIARLLRPGRREAAPLAA
jgi:phosphatidylglycerol lysyltransferase